MAIPLKPDDQNKGLQPVAQNAAQKQGSGFTNIQRIAQANQGNRLGQAVGGGVQAVGQQAKQAVGQAKNEFGQAVQSSNEYLNDAKATQDKVSSVVADPNANVDAEVSNFEKYRSGLYNGPKQLGNYADLQQQSQAAQQLGQGLTSSGGRTALLQRFAAKPASTYSAGQSRMDSALMSMGPQDQLQAARRDTRGLVAQTDTANQAAGAQANEYQARAKALADYTNQQVQGQQNPVLEQLTLAAKTATDDRDRIANAIETGTATADDLRAVGLEHLVGKDTYGLDLSKIITSSTGAADRLGVANSTQAARLNALARLGGQVDLQNEFKDSANAGKFSANRFSGADKAIEEHSKLGSAVSTLNNEQGGISSNAYQQARNAMMGNMDAYGTGTIGDNARKNMAAKVDSILTPALVDSYINGDEATKKQIREGALGDTALYGFNNPGQMRDAISGLLNQAAARKTAIQQELAKFGSGKFGLVKAQIAAPADPGTGPSTSNPYH